MKRREMFKLGAGVAAGFALGGTGCALPGVRQEGDRLIPEDMDAFLGGWDASLARTRESRFVETFAEQASGTPLTAEVRASLAPREKLFQDMLHTMLLTQSFRDLSPEAQAHPEVQRRMVGHIDEVDATVGTITDQLAGLDDDQRADIRRMLQENPDLVMRIAETLNGEASRAGVTLNRRVQLRSMMTHASFRLGKTDPGTVIDEYVDKVRRASDPDRIQYLASQSAAVAGSRAFFQSRERSGFSEPQADLPPEQRPGMKAVKSGAWMMGIGVITFGISGLLVSADMFPFVFGMTAGAVLFAIGLITLIVGGIIMAVKSKH